MIKFFRKIRYNLLSENKTGKYFKYAIGEIILVVIGILIALSINNWNENQKKYKNEAYTLQQLHQEAKQIITAIEGDMEIMSEYIEASKFAIKCLQNEKLIDNDTAYFGKGVEGITFYPALSVPRNVYDEINSAGLLREIRSVEIRNTIAQYYADLNWIESQLDYFRDVVLSRGGIYRKGFYVEFNEASSSMKSYEVDFDELVKNKEFRTLLSNGVRNLIVFQKNRGRLLNSANTMCEVLSNEDGKSCYVQK